MKIVCCNVRETKARYFWLLEVENGKPVWLFDSLHGLMPITLEVTRKLWITGFLLVKSQTDCPVLKSKELELVAGKLAKELELVAGKLARKERQSVAITIAVQSRTAWLRATHQQITKSAAKVKKASVKRSPTEQKITWQVFRKGQESQSGQTVY